MRYAEIQVGQKVLVSHYRPSQKSFSVAHMESAEVLEKGVEHRFQVTVNSGWQQTTQYRTTRDGVRLLVQRHNREPHVTGETELLPAEYELVTIAARVFSAEGEMMAEWQAARDQEERSLEARTRSSLRLRTERWGGDYRVIVDNRMPPLVVVDKTVPEAVVNKIIGLAAQLIGRQLYHEELARAERRA